MGPDDRGPKRPVAPHIKYKSTAMTAEASLLKSTISRLEQLEQGNEAHKTALAELKKENEAQKQALAELLTELQVCKDFHADGPGPWTEYEFQAYLKYPSNHRAPSPQTDYDENVAAEWDGGENVHDILNVKRLQRHGATQMKRVCKHLPPWTDVDGNPVGKPMRVSHQDKFGKPGLLTCEDGRGWFCRSEWPSMFHCLKCGTYFCRPCGRNPGVRRPKWIVELEQQWEAAHEK